MRARPLTKPAAMPPRNPALRLLSAVLCLLPPIAHAYSGAGGECADGALESAALRGTPAQLDAAIDARVAAVRQRVDGWSSGVARLYPDTSAVWLNRDVRRSPPAAQRQTFVGWWRGCQGITLLDAAIAGQNLPTVRHLLALGSHPNTPSPGYEGSTPLMRCAHLNPGSALISTYAAAPARDRDSQETTAALYTLLLAGGGSVAQRTTRGLTALHLCDDPFVIDLLVRQAPGADALINARTEPDWKAPRLLDYRIRKLLDGGRPGRDAQQAILETILPRIADRQVGGETERAIGRACREPDQAAVCAWLASRVTVTDRTVFQGRPATP